MLVSTEETGEIYEFDNPTLGDVVKNIIRPYIKNEEFQVDGFFIEPSKVKRMMITKTDNTSSYYQDLEYRSLAKGVFFPISRGDYVFKEGNHFSDISRELLKSIKDENQPSDKRKVNQSTSPCTEGKTTIFLAYSYREVDNEFVEGFKDLLIDKGYNVLDGKADRLGSISHAILEKIRLSDITVVVMTKRDKKENGNYTTAAWLLEEKGAAIALGKEVAMFVEEEVDDSDIGGLQGDDQRFHFNRNNFLKVVMNFVKVIESAKK